MKLELELDLVAKFPELCKQYGGDSKETCFAFGFQCHDGWFSLIQQTLSEIDSIAKESDISVSIAQIKSKFGKLTIYLDFEPQSVSCGKKQNSINRIYEIISKAHDLSANISEVSGLPGSLTSVGGWIVCLTENENEIAQKYGISELLDKK